MNTANTAIVANQAELTKAVKRENSAAKARRAPSKGTVIKAATADTVKKAKKTPQVEALPGMGVMGALAGALSKDKASAKEETTKAIAKAKKPATPKAAVPASAKLVERYTLGAYNGKAGAMYAFVMRCGTLGDTFTRLDAIASVEKKAAHDALATRAQVLDYFAWAVRHGLVVLAKDQSAPAAAPVAAKSKKPLKQLSDSLNTLFKPSKKGTVKA